jgi:hypothetical protein
MQREHGRTRGSALRVPARGTRVAEAWARTGARPRARPRARDTRRATRLPARGQGAGQGLGRWGRDSGEGLAGTRPSARGLAGARPGAGKGAGAARRGQARGRLAGARDEEGAAGTWVRRGARDGVRGGRAGEEEGEGKEREGEGGEGKIHLRGSKFRRSRLQTLGHHGEREVAAREIQMREGEEEGAHGEVGRDARGTRAGPGHFADRNSRHARPSNGLQSRIEIRDRTRRTRDIKQRNALRHDATHMTLRFWFIHDTDTCHYTGLKLGRKSETGREKRVTPEFGERKEEKNSTPKFRALQTYPP